MPQCLQGQQSYQRLSKAKLSFDLTKIIRKGIKNRPELLAYANEQTSKGKYDMAEFIVNCPPLPTAWEMNMAQEKQDHAKKCRIEILEEASQGECALSRNSG